MVGPRQPGPDLVRIVGLAAIVIGHVYSAEHEVRLATYTWHVPVFFILSGYLWQPGRGAACRYGQTCPNVARAICQLVGASVRVRRPAPSCPAWWLIRNGSVHCLLVCHGALHRSCALPTARRTPPTIRVGALVAGLTVNLVAGSTLARIPWSVGTAVWAVFFVGAGQLLRWASNGCHTSRGHGQPLRC